MQIRKDLKLLSEDTRFNRHVGNRLGEVSAISSLNQNGLKLMKAESPNTRLAGFCWRWMRSNDKGVCNADKCAPQENGYNANMILLNFSHPLTDEQLSKIGELSSRKVEQVMPLAIQFIHDQPFLPQLQEVLRKVTLTPEQWQTAPIIVNLPSFNYITALLLAELHGRMGYFPPILRLKPVEGAMPPRYEVAEVINLQAVRDDARKLRY